MRAARGAEMGIEHRRDSVLAQPTRHCCMHVVARALRRNQLANGVENR
ncbi:MAG TPA: hypothetical protein VGL35_06030 [Rhizomicrobium sp.]